MLRVCLRTSLRMLQRLCVKRRSKSCRTRDDCQTAMLQTASADSDSCEPAKLQGDPWPQSSHHSLTYCNLTIIAQDQPFASRSAALHATDLGSSIDYQML